MNDNKLLKQIKLMQKRKKEIYNLEENIETRIYYLAQIEAYNEVLYILENEANQAAEKADKENQ